MYSKKNITSVENIDFTRTMLELFVKSITEFINDIKLALNKEDLIKINDLAHKIKPSLMIMEVNSVVPLIKEIESSTTVDDKLRNTIYNTLNKLNLINDQIKYDLSFED
jgi:HPt (histidine-containing phosphotransfer) domain-containing protein